MGQPTTAFLRVFLSASLFYFFIAPVACNANLRFCATVHVSPGTCLRVTSSYLNWGKWIISYYNTNELYSWWGTNNPFTFCAAGREGSATGTSGGLALAPCGYDTWDYSISIYWSRPWFGSSYVTEKFNENFLAVQRTMTPDWQYRYEVTIRQ